MNDDLISRQAVLEYIDNMPFEMTEDGRYMVRRIRLTEYISDTLPSAEREKGQWIRHILKNAKAPWGFDCSACGTWFVIGEDTAEGYNYCPNCGAEMRGEEDG